MTHSSGEHRMKPTDYQTQYIEEMHRNTFNLARYPKQQIRR